MTHMIRDKSFYKTLFAIAIPIVLQNIISVGVSIMDTVMVGTLGEIQLSASSLATNYVEISHILHLGIVAGGCILIAQYWGAGDIHSIKKVVALMFRICFICGCVLMAFAIAIPAQIMRLYTTDEEVITSGVIYLRWILPVFVLHGFSIVMTFSLRSMRKVKVPFCAAFVTFLVNIFFNWMFIFGHLGAPRMGIAGAALGTTLSRVAEFMAIGVCYFARNNHIKIRIRDLFMQCSDKLGVFLKFGIPVIISDLLLTVGNNIVSIIMGHIGTIFVAAYAIVAPAMRLVSIAAMGLAQAAATLTGNAVGGQTRKATYDCGFTCFILSLVIGVLSGLFLVLFDEALISFYNVLPETRAIATELMDALALISVFQAVGVVLTKGVLRGGGDSKFVLVFDTLFLWLTSVPLGYLCGLVLKAPVFITFFALRIDNVFKAFACGVRLKNGKWIKRVDIINKMEDEECLQ